MSGVIGIGLDLVTVSEFAEQLARPGTAMSTSFTVGERRDAASRGSDPARHLAARWAAKEAVIKAWSGSRFAHRPVLAGIVHAEIEVVTDAWGRPSIRLSGDVMREMVGLTIHVSLTHDGDIAAAVAVVEDSSPDAVEPVSGRDGATVAS